MNAPISREEYLQLLLARQQKPEKSRALPASAYRDPAESVKLESEKAKKAKPRKVKPPKVNKRWR